MTLNHLAANKPLQDHAEKLQKHHMRDLFEQNPSRYEQFSAQAPEIFLDYSKNLIDQEALDDLIKLAVNADLEDAIRDMFTGKAINQTEQRPALHTALRNSEPSELCVGGINIFDEVQAVKQKVYDFVDAIHQQRVKGYTGRNIDTLVSIGIGGSYLGPSMVYTALTPYKLDGFESYFVANIDASDLQRVLKIIDPETTLFLIQSKSFGTQETLENALAAREWFLAQGASQNDITRHFAAVSSNVSAAQEFGIDPERVFPMWDWVGGRYSLWSAIGLPIVFQFGKDRFEALLSGAHAMDQHFQNTPFSENVPVITALLGIWYNNYLDAASHAVLPYDQYLELLPAYLQQLDMESNGKSVSRRGEVLDYATGPVIWGGVGCNGQHAYHQLLHQGTSLVPVDFIATLQSHHDIRQHHTHLFANCLAQAQAMMQGKDLASAFKELKASGCSDSEANKLAPHKVIAGNKPSNMLVVDKLTPRSLGALVALYEHKVFVQGVIWDVNSFDQWGVELGKTMEAGIYEILAEKIQGRDAELEKDLDSSTRGLINRYAQYTNK